MFDFKRRKYEFVLKVEGNGGRSRKISHVLCVCVCVCVISHRQYSTYYYHLIQNHPTPEPWRRALSLRDRNPEFRESSLKRSQRADIYRAIMVIVYTRRNSAPHSGTYIQVLIDARTHVQISETYQDSHVTRDARISERVQTFRLRIEQRSIGTATLVS